MNSGNRVTTMCAPDLVDRPAGNCCQATTLSFSVVLGIDSPFQPSWRTWRFWVVSFQATHWHMHVYKLVGGQQEEGSSCNFGQQQWFVAITYSIHNLPHSLGLITQRTKGDNVRTGNQHCKVPKQTSVIIPYWQSLCLHAGCNSTLFD